MALPNPDAAVGTFDGMATEVLAPRLSAVCGSTRWVSAMLEARPFRDRTRLQERAAAIWMALEPSDWLEAFVAHPRLGERPAGVDQHAAWSSLEQRGALEAGAAIRQRLAALNRAYQERFGFVFILCAAGRTAEHMVHALEARLPHEREEELQIAAAEQAAILHLRLDRLLAELAETPGRSDADANQAGTRRDRTDDARA